MTTAVTMRTGGRPGERIEHATDHARTNLERGGDDGDIGPLDESGEDDVVAPPRRTSGLHVVRVSQGALAGT